MATAASAFPRLSPSGLRVVAGEKTLVLDQSIEIGPGTSAQWADETSLYYTRQPDGAFMAWNGTGVVVRQPGFNTFTVGGPGRWAGYNAEQSAVEFDNGTVVPGWSSPALSTDPSVWAALVHANGRIITGIGTPAKYASASCRDLRFCGRALAWNVFVDGRWQIAGMRQLNETPELLNIEREEFWPVPLLVEGELWLMTHSHDRLLLRPWASREGYVVATGITHTPDAKQLPNGWVRIVWDAGHNVLEDVRLDPKTRPRVDLDAPVVPTAPVEDTSGQPVDLWSYVLPSAGAFPRTSREPGHGHEMHCVFDGRNVWTLPFGEPDHWVRMVVEGDTLTFREDRSRDNQNTGDYSFTHGLWARRQMRVGDRILKAQNNLVRYQPDGCRVVDVHAFPFRTGLWKRWTSFDCGGDLGRQDVIAYLYDPGGMRDTYELSYFAKGYGFFRWEEYDQQTNQRRHWTTFNEFGGRAPQPTTGCWKREHLALRPETQDPPDEDGMTKQELIGTEIHRDFVLGAWTRFIGEVALGRDVIDGTTREDALTDTVGTRGLAMYFFPLYYRATMQAIDRLGRVPRNPAEWGGVSIAGFEAAKAVYLREQAGGGPVVEPPPPPPPPPPVEGRIVGQLRTESGGGFVDDTGPVLPILCHFGDALSRWSRGQQAAVAADLDDIAAAGYHGLRFWSTLGGDSNFWHGRGVGPVETPDYWSHLQAFLEALRDRGLVCQFSLGDTRRVVVSDLREFAARAGDAINAVGPHVVALGLEVNEDRDTGHLGAERIAEFNRWFREKCPRVLVGLSAFTGTEDVAILNDYSRAPADVFVCHGYRGGRWWDKVRHIFSLVYEGKPSKRLGWQGEPAGPGALVSAIDNKHELDADALCAMAAMSLMTRQAWVYFSGPGVKSDDGERLQDMPGFREVPRVRALLPPDVMRYDEVFHGGDTWREQRIFAAQGEVRADHAYYRDGRFACLVYGPGGLDVPQTRAARIDVDHRFGAKARLIVGQAS